jgi:hypothetical protein
MPVACPAMKFMQPRLVKPGEIFYNEEKTTWESFVEQRVRHILAG